MPESQLASSTTYTPSHRRHHEANREASLLKMRQYYQENKRRILEDRKRNYVSKKTPRPAVVPPA